MHEKLKRMCFERILSILLDWRMLLLSINLNDLLSIHASLIYLTLFLDDRLMSH